MPGGIYGKQPVTQGNFVLHSTLHNNQVTAEYNNEQTFKRGLQHGYVNTRKQFFDTETVDVSRAFWRTEAFLVAEDVPSLDKACMAFLNL